MPTYDAEGRFYRDYERLTPEEVRAFQVTVRKFVADLKRGGGFRAGLRMRRVVGHPGVYELTWAPDGRATFVFGDPVREGDLHVVWRRIGDHSIFDDP